MANLKLKPAGKLSGKPVIPGDKSVSHRSLMFGALASGQTTVSHLLESGDVHSTWRCLEAMGARIERFTEAGQARVRVHGLGNRGLQAPRGILDCGNSGTTMRLLMGILAGQAFKAELTGDDSLRRRPMKRVAEPLRRMGARIDLTNDQTAPLVISGGNLKSLSYDLPVASAQLKSALLLAGLFARGETRLGGMIESRDHTERLLPHFGVKLSQKSGEVSIVGGQSLHAAHVNVPGDISSAAFWLVAAAIVPGSSLEIENVSLNPSRVGILKVLERMGVGLETEMTEELPEPIGKLRISFNARGLEATRITPDEVPELVDEIPVITVLATQARGTTEIRGAEELRVKESDRIEATAAGLRAMGAEVETLPDGFRIHGPQKLKGAVIESVDDHRIAMAFSIASLIAAGETEIRGTECVAISYPNFYQTLAELTSGGR
jgi:3-phosphoshikimate 1-carboxyvinyltransferase